MPWLKFNAPWFSKPVHIQVPITVVPYQPALTPGVWWQQRPGGVWVGPFSFTGDQVVNSLREGQRVVVVDRPDVELCC